jgi:hypothetical protein
MDQTTAPKDLPPGFEDVLSFPLSAALLGRRARRFSVGATIPDGPLAYESRRDTLPLTELEQMLVLTAAGGNTGWHYAITRNATYAPHLPNYAGAAGGRTFPSAAGFHTSELFFTDDDGVYVFETRDAPALATPGPDGSLDIAEVLDGHRKRIKKLYDGRMNIPAEEPYMEGHNTWCANRPGSTVIMPIVDLAQHAIAGLCFLVQNGVCVYDDINDRTIPGTEKFGALVNLEEPFPLSYFDQYMLTEATAEIATACYAGMLMLQAMGLGGWMFDGIDRHTTLGATGDPAVPGFGFRYDTDDRWPIPNVTGIPGVFEGHCPPHHPDMSAAVEAFVQRKFGPGGPFHPDTPGAWRESAKVRGSAQEHDDDFKECVALMAQYMFDTFGKFPATVPSIFSLMYLQTHHLDLDFYDHHFSAGAYLQTHADHMERWH